MTPRELMEGVALRLAALWPERVIYREVCPDDHQRPSAYVQVLEADPQRANLLLVRWRVRLLVTLWRPLDDYGLASEEALLGDKFDAMAALLGTPLAVGDRHITLQAADKGQDPGDGAGFVEVTAEWTDALPGAPNSDPPGEAPLMEHIIGDINDKEEINCEYDQHRPAQDPAGV